MPTTRVAIKKIFDLKIYKKTKKIKCEKMYTNL